jgi:hypothetical protein
MESIEGLKGSDNLPAKPKTTGLIFQTVTVSPVQTESKFPENSIASWLGRDVPDIALEFVATCVIPVEATNLREVCEVANVAMVSNNSSLINAPSSVI